jgi:hypothetical protein
MSLRRIASPVLLLALAFALTACDPGANGTASDTPAPTDTPTPSSTPTPEPADPEPIVATCENIVSPATITGFASNGLVITPAADFAAKMSSEGNALAVFFDAGGVLCQVGNGLEAFEVYGYGVLNSAQISTLAGQFLADGYVETVGDVGVQYQVPDDMEGQPRLCYLRPDAFSICGGDDTRLQEIMATLGLG